MNDLLFNVGYGAFVLVLLALAVWATRAQERARCAAIVAGRICAGHWPRRDLVAMLNEPCDHCDRVTECLHYIEEGK